MVSTYYAQRACEPGTLLITEGTFISPRAGGYSNVPGIYNDEQIAAWRNVTDAVHDQGSYIFLQLWALGRTANAEKLKADGFDVTSSSAVPMSPNGPVPKELTVPEINEFVADYAQAARNAIEAGFDGVEIHGANGYLVDQFIQDNVNRRTDDYGGSIEKRSRFAVEVATAIVDAVGADRVAIRLSPFSTFQGMKMEDPIPQFTHLLQALKPLKLAYIHVVQSVLDGDADPDPKEKVDFVVDTWDSTSPVIIAGNFKAASASKAVDEDYPDKEVVIAFGKRFISTPDLIFRLKHGINLSSYDRSTFYAPKSETGYIDQPFSKEFERVNKASKLA
jgi:NADPH2 dehydrogenase